MQRSAWLLLLLTFTASCGEAVKDDHFKQDVSQPAQEAPAQLEQPAVPVRIGELGASFDACGSAGTTRNLDAGGGLEVKAAPFDAAAVAGRVPAGARVFICARSHDQRWLGIVYNDAGELSAECGVSSPVTSRRDYPGPCRSGWVSSAFIKLIAG
jgi:hypothetical protein